MPPSDFSGRAGRCGVQILPFLCKGLPDSISAESASTVAVTAVPALSEAASSSVVSMPDTGLRPALARVFGSVEPPIEVPRADLEAAISTFLRCLPALEAISRWVSTAEASASASSCFTQSATEPCSGAPSKDDCGASSKPFGAGDFFGDLAMRGIWRESLRKGRGKEYKRETNESLRALTPQQRNTVVASYLGWTLDAFDFFILVFVLRYIAEEFHTDVPAVSVAIFLTLAMRALGALIFGLAADRYGRRITLMADVLLYSLFEFLTGFSTGLTMFLVLRALYGIAMGGEWGVGASLVMETVPEELRGIVSGILQAGYPSGYLIASLVSSCCSR